MSQMIACPSCHSQIEVTEILRAQITAEVRSENDAAARRQQAEISEMRRKLDAEQEAIESARENIQQQVKNLLESQRSELLAKAKLEAMQAVGVEIKDRETELSELKTKLTAAMDHCVAASGAVEQSLEQCIVPIDESLPLDALPSMCLEQCIDRIKRLLIDNGFMLPFVDVFFMSNLANIDWIG